MASMQPLVSVRTGTLPDTQIQTGRSTSNSGGRFSARQNPRQVHVYEISAVVAKRLQLGERPILEQRAYKIVALAAGAVKPLLLPHWPRRSQLSGGLKVVQAAARVWPDMHRRG